MKGAGHKVQTSSYKIRKLWDITNSTAIIVNSIVLYTSKLLREILKVRITRIEAFVTV